MSAIITANTAIHQKEENTQTSDKKIMFDIHKTDSKGQTLLHLAVHEGQVEDVKALLGAGADVNKLDARGYSALHRALCDEEVEIAKIILNTGKFTVCNAVLSMRGDTALTLAAALGDEYIIEQLIKAGANVNVKRNDDETPLTIAIKEKNMNAAKVLIRANADLSPNGYSILRRAYIDRHWDLIEPLLQAGADVNVGNPPLLEEVVHSRNPALVKAFLNAKVKPNLKKVGPSLLECAIVQHNIEIVELLIAAGVDINAQSNGGTALHHAVQCRDKHITQLLINHNADVNKIDEGNYKPIDLVYGLEGVEIYLMLTQAGANIERGQACSTMQYPLGMADVAEKMAAVKESAHKLFDIAEKGYKTIEELKEILALLGKGLNGRLNIFKGNFDTGYKLVHKQSTALHLAIIYQQFEVAILLIKAGANINITDGDGITPLDLIKGSEIQFKMRCLYLIGSLYAKDAVHSDNVKAIEYYEQAARLGHAQAQHSLGRMYKRGRGVKKDLVLAFYWIRKSAEQGNTDAQFELAMMLDSDLLPGCRKIDESRQWLRKVRSSLSENLLSCHLDIRILEYRGSAIKEVLQDAIAGDAEAQCHYGVICADGRNSTCGLKDLSQAEYWFRKSAEQGHSEGQFNLAQMIFYKDCLPKDNETATSWYIKAAEQDYGEAITQLQLLASKKQDKEAIEWLKKHKIEISTEKSTEKAADQIEPEISKALVGSASACKTAVDPVPEPIIISYTSSRRIASSGKAAESGQAAEAVAKAAVARDKEKTKDAFPSA